MAALFAPACSELPSSVGEGAGDAASAAAGGSTALVGAKLWVDPASSARKQVDAWRTSRPADAAQIEEIARQPQAIWLGDWISRPYETVSRLTATISASGAVPVYVLYNIPNRDCGQHSAGGAPSGDAYLHWISEVARGIGGRPAAVILEPDALGLMGCSSAGAVESRYRLLRDAVARLKSRGDIAVYIDAGHARWLSAEETAERLSRAGIRQADGFSLNVAFYLSTEESVNFGERVSALAGGKHFVIDTGRNGLGPSPDLAWCNAAGRGLGAAPTTRTGHPLVDAYLWIKHPGASDGECNGGPPAGTWWPEYALGLAQRSAP